PRRARCGPGRRSRPRLTETDERTCAFRALAPWQVAATRAVVTGPSRRASLAARAARYRKNELDETARQTVEFLERRGSEDATSPSAPGQMLGSHVTGAAVGHDR